MKNSFISLLFASCLGTLLALGALILIGVVSISSLVSKFEDKEVSVDANSVLVLKPGFIPELTNNVPSNPFELEQEKVLGLRDMVRALELAADDDDIKGIYLQTNGFASAPASSSTLREAILRFRESGKFVVSHASYYDQGDYYLASAGDAVYLNPTGGIDARGFGATLPFFKEALDKAGIDANVFYAGDFKSAGEPFIRNSISDSNRLQTREYLSDLWDIWLQDVSASRNLEYGELKRLTEKYLIRNDRDAEQYGLVDGLLYNDQVRDNLRERLGLDEDDDLNTVDIGDYFSKVKSQNLLSKERIAVLYAEGNIVDGRGDQGSIGGRAYVETIRELREDDRVKAIVLRVNSGGGSALASENVWRELSLAREQGKAVVTSMGDFAASGGYYIAAATDSIFAMPNTITGSIGVVAVVPNFSELMDDRLGINFDTVNTGEYSTAFTTVLPWSQRDKAVIQEGIQDIYELFVKRVADGRDLPVAKVKQLAKGRVYTGRDAIELGLVDQLGGIDQAIEAAARMADVDLDDARIVEYPKVKDAMQLLVAELTGDEDDGSDITLTERLLERELGTTYQQYRLIRNLAEEARPQTMLLERPSFQ